MRQFDGRLESVFFLQENLHAHKSPRLGGGGWFFGGRGSADFIFTGRGDFSDYNRILPVLEREELGP